MQRWLDSLVFSSTVAAAVAAALSTAAGLALGDGARPAAAGLAACGTWAVYNLDRLRDLERDRLTAPARSAFVARHSGALAAWTGLCAAAGLGLALSLGPAVCALCAAAAVPGLLHRRLKWIPIWKGLYVTVGWLAVVVGVPALLAPQAGRAAVTRVGAVLGCAILANLAASSLRDRESLARFVSRRAALSWARGLAAAGCALAWLAPSPVDGLIWIPLAELASLIRFRDSERYGLWAVDGALLAGALLAIPGLPR